MKFAGPLHNPATTAVLIITGLLTGAGMPARADEAPAASTSSAPPYTVVCETNEAEGATVCKVDKQTYIGWRTYHAVCHVCHAQDAVGSTFAPSLVERVGAISEERFMDVVANGYTGQIGVMPAWKDNPNVNKRYDALYSYLKARADGVLPPGRPQRLDK